MTKDQRRHLDHQLERLIASVPTEIATAAMTDFGVLTSRIPKQFHASARRLQALAIRVANDT